MPSDSESMQNLINAVTQIEGAQQHTPPASPPRNTVRSRAAAWSSSHERDLVYARFFDPTEYTHAIIGEVLGRTAQACRLRLFRMLQDPQRMRRHIAFFRSRGFVLHREIPGIARPPSVILRLRRTPLTTAAQQAPIPTPTHRIRLLNTTQQNNTQTTTSTQSSSTWTPINPRNQSSTGFPPISPDSEDNDRNKPVSGWRPL